MNFEVLNDATLWVAISFILFLVLVIKPAFNQITKGLDTKIKEMEARIKDSEILKKNAENLYREQLRKNEQNEILIKKIKSETETEAKNIKKRIEREIEQNMVRKINNYNLISIQMENNLKDELKNEILEKVISYTENRIKKDFSNKQNENLIDDTLKNIPKKLS